MHLRDIDSNFNPDIHMKAFKRLIAGETSSHGPVRTYATNNFLAFFKKTAVQFIFIEVKRIEIDINFFCELLHCH